MESRFLLESPVHGEFLIYQKNQIVGSSAQVRSLLSNTPHASSTYPQRPQRHVLSLGLHSCIPEHSILFISANDTVLLTTAHAELEMKTSMRQSPSSWARCRNYGTAFEKALRCSAIAFELQEYINDFTFLIDGLP
jgi:hypothetical protein